MVKIKKCCHAGINNEDDIPATTTVATIWSAKRFKFLALYRDATIATISGRGVESHAIYK
jgi:hypothetical protein